MYTAITAYEEMCDREQKQKKVNRKHEEEIEDLRYFIEELLLKPLSEMTAKEIWHILVDGIGLDVPPRKTKQYYMQYIKENENIIRGR